MPTVQWIGNAANFSQVVTFRVTAVATNGLLTATLNGGVISYTCLSTDTVATAMTGWLALLAASTTPPEYQEITFASSVTATGTATAKQAGVPFAGMGGGLEFTASGGAAVTATITTPNSSESDAANPQNYSRNGVASLPQNDDDFDIGNSAVPILWNLDTAIPAVKLASVTRRQSFTATIGLPVWNPNGYYEYRYTRFKLFGGGTSGTSSSMGQPTQPVLPVVLGFGGGSGPTRERYDFQTQQVNVQALASGQPQDTYAIDLIGTNSSNVISTIVGTSVGVGTLPGDTVTLASATVGTNGVISLGPDCTFSGTLTLTGGAALLNCSVPVILAQDNSQMAQGTLASALHLSYPSITLKNRSTLSWQSGSNIGTFVMQTGSSFNKSPTTQPMTITALTIDVAPGTQCQFVDPYNSVSFSTPVVLNGALQSGPFFFAAGRTFTIA